MKLIKCQECSKTRTDEPDYNPMLLIYRQGSDPGWYSNIDGELCGPCMLALFRKANGR